MPPYSRRLLTIPEVAALYGVSKYTAWRWVQRGYFDAIQLPGRRGQWRVYEDSTHAPTQDHAASPGGTEEEQSP